MIKSAKLDNQLITHPAGGPLLIRKNYIENMRNI